MGEYGIIIGPFFTKTDAWIDDYPIFQYPGFDGPVHGLMQVLTNLSHEIFVIGAGLHILGSSTHMH